VAEYFLDSSALVKRYVQEIGTGWVNLVVDPGAGNSIWLARISGVELVSAISRRQRAGSIYAADAGLMLTEFRHEFATEYRVVELTPTLVAHAMALAETPRPARLRCCAAGCRAGGGR